MDEYTLPIKDRMRVRHDAQVRFIVRSGTEVLEDRLTPVNAIGGAMTVAGIMYNGLTMSGGVRWQHPGTGRPIERPRVTMLVRECDVLTGDQECDCQRCVPTTSGVGWPD